MQINPQPMILGDWGTSRLRLFLVADGRALDRIEGPGIGLMQGTPSETFAALVAPWLATHRPGRALLCGMAGARSGLFEVPYAPCPVDSTQWADTATTNNGAPIAITIAAGVCCEHADGAPDVMRGEEAQIFGALSLRTELGHGRHVIVLPGTHSKWAHLDEGRITSFHTCVTGEMFALLCNHSMLTRAAGAEPEPNDSSERDGFLAGLARAAVQKPLSCLFESRSARVLKGRSRAWALGFISGLLIGQELNEGLLSFGQPGHIVLIGDPLLTVRYCVALARQRVTAIEMDGDACVLAGLRLLGGMANWNSHVD